MRRIILVLALAGNVGLNVVAQNKPKLVVGIVVDQMRQEYLYRFQSKFGADGFNRLMGEGFVLKNAHYNYAPTVTGPGHASVYTGTTPAVHGIIGNEWFDKVERKDVYCAGDDRHKAVGSTLAKGNVSPWRLVSSTVTDELKLATQKRAKVIGMSFKDRGAALPAGHMPDAAYWFDSKTGSFVTSTYYMQDLPVWVKNFNQKKLADQYLAKTWTPLLPIEQYVESGPDDSPYEQRLAGKDRPVFPYVLPEMRKKSPDYDLLSYTPFANDFLTEFAKLALDAEQMGKDEISDFLAISFSMPDILGHAVGPNAVEIEDTYLRLDRNIADLLKTLDDKVGKNQYVVFLTADHAVADVAQYLKDNRLPAGYFNFSNARALLNDYMKQYFPDRDVVLEVDGEKVFLNHAAFMDAPRTAGVDFLVATELIANFLLRQEGVANVFTSQVLRESSFNEGGIKGMVTRGFHPKRSGDLTIVLEPGWYGAGRVQGTTHGSPYTYDTHVPVIFFGGGIRKGSSVKYHPITDVAPTISVLLQVKFPSGATGQPVEELFEN